MGWWARQDSNLEPRDYEYHELIELGGRKLKKAKGFPVSLFR